eukprot:CAMPEP_0179423244 /NCGR_PEP_ID=MMETSP0799-20121207/10894_1 /TAXON_ID=46947 /ORGANISM="Geminigera cryophila, Strain CCMP2564" /LENGTH=333 /DNA_ID=CAMNT_0021197501 /DNA_START=29 /DNA_END=1027 /DNA_ORIENTATION=-
MEAWYGSPQGQRGEHGEVGHRRAGAVHRRAAGLQAESVKNVSESRNTTTFVDVLIEQNTTTFANNDPSSIPKLNNETTENHFFQDSSTLPWTLWNPNVLWFFCAALCVFTAVTLAALALRRNDSSFSCRSLHALAFMFAVTSMGYLVMALGLGHIQEVYGVEVFDGIVDTPGRLLWRAVVPPIVWLRHVSWVFTSAIQLHLIMSAASNGARQLEAVRHPGATMQMQANLRELRPLHSSKKRSSTVPLEMRFYVISINTLMHVSGLIGTVVPKNELSKWLYWLFGCAMFAMILNQLTSNHGQISKVASKNKVLPHYRALCRITLSVWGLYPLIW